ncbi:hypothetical protein TBLA_0D01480 [Henningerozyma blattae CBS 6284]|uniref:DUF3955 domain-containing protein n=1 Tax=Henningerozyma blattae (strain ATCC 34711 / CBS 6284 / DSM 70876 / NBRC 10599 / NRRL Y-10934 / UCD 77-7) TaxID=1071380 RepID=I2H2Q3_HENB6|nr:hypothetical protein TBLA_0D01480 [Tetrapisispora blattae CBS 6284]CCH60655.1 hypothetical protein TBLA_0D01480 [Tetrapisispora blattae CBS 6284]
MKMIAKFNRRWAWGLLLLSAVVLLWVLSSFLVSIIFEDASYRKPFAITYINTAAFVLYLIPTVKRMYTTYKLTGTINIHSELVAEEESPPISRRNSSMTTRRNSLYLPSSTDQLLDDQHNRYDSNKSIHETSNLSILDEDLELSSDNTPFDAIRRLSLRETINLSAQFCVIWFVANFATNASLAYTSVASQTILSSTSSFFTLFVGGLFHVECVTKIKVFGSVVSFVGILLVTKTDYVSMVNSESVKALFNLSETHTDVYPNIGNAPYSNADGNHVLWGNALALLGALLYSIYSILLKIKVREESRVNMELFFGFVGLFTLIFLWPSMVVLHYMGWETFEIPTSPRVIIIIVANCILTFVSDYCWANAMLLTSPLTVTVGLTLTIPLAMFGDVIFIHKSISPMYALGAVLIVGSFFIINKSSEEDNFEQALEESQEDNAF